MPNNGAEALAHGRAAGRSIPATWDLILMDVQMPVMNGNDSTRAIRALGGAAAADPDPCPVRQRLRNRRSSKACDAGMNDHIVKPIDFALLSRAIDHWAAPSNPPVKVPVHA